MLLTPNPVSNSDFTKILGKVLSRPTIFSIPKFIIKAALGEQLADALLLSSARVMPIRLTKTSRYQFRFPYLDLALETYSWKKHLVKVFFFILFSNLQRV